MSNRDLVAAVLGGIRHELGPQGELCYGCWADAAFQEIIDRFNLL